MYDIITQNYKIRENNDKPILCHTIRVHRRGDITQTTETFDSISVNCVAKQFCTENSDTVKAIN